MFGRALLPLLARPRAIALFVLGIAVTLSPALLRMAIGTEELDQTQREATAILFAGASLGCLGFACGLAIKQTAWCSFAWTTPRFRQRLRGEFLAISVVLALATTVLMMVAFRPALGVFPVVLLTSVAALAFGCAFITLPDSSYLVLVPVLAWFIFRARWLEAVIERPLAFAAVAAVIGTISVRATCSTRTFRWAGLRQMPSPITTWAKGWLPAPNAKGRGSAHHATAACEAARYRSRLPDADTLVRRMVAMSRALGVPVGWLLLLLLGTGLLMGALSSVNGRPVAAPNTTPMPWDWTAAGMIGLVHVMLTSLVLRATLPLPWSRRDHLAATWSWHVASALWCALVALPLFALVTQALGSPGWTTAGAARMIGSTLLLFPAGWRVRADPFGRTRSHLMRLGLLLLVFRWGPTVADGLLVALLPTVHLQIFMVWVLVLASQIAHWFLLKRDFEHRDLVGESS